MNPTGIPAGIPAGIPTVDTLRAPRWSDPARGPFRFGRLRFGRSQNVPPSGRRTTTSYCGPFGVSRLS